MFHWRPIVVSNVQFLVGDKYHQTQTRLPSTVRSNWPHITRKCVIVNVHQVSLQYECFNWFVSIIYHRIVSFKDLPLTISWNGGQVDQVILCHFVSLWYYSIQNVLLGTHPDCTNVAEEATSVQNIDSDSTNTSNGQTIGQGRFGIGFYTWLHILVYRIQWISSSEVEKTVASTLRNIIFIQNF